MDFNSSKWNDRPFKSSSNRTTKVTCSSFDFKSHLAAVVAKVLGPRITAIKSTVFPLLAKQGAQSQIVMFLNHCATLIQSSWRGYQQRKYYRKFQPVMWRFKELLMATALGWKVRRIMKTKLVERKLTKIKQDLGNKNQREVRIMKRELIDDIFELQKKGKWLHHLQPSKQNSRNMKNSKVIILRSVLKNSHMGHGEKTNTRKMTIETSENGKMGNEELRLHQMTNPQQEVPIKANGYYKIDADLQIQGKQQTNKSSKPKSKLKLENKARSARNKEVSKPQEQKGAAQVKKEEIKQKQESIANPENKKESNSLTDKKAEQAQQKQQKVGCVKQQEVENMAKLKLIETQHNNQNELLRSKKIGRGIKVTLCDPNDNKVSKKFDSRDPQALTKTSNMVVPNEVKWESLGEIGQVYKTSYLKKMAEVSQKYNQMRGSRKFLN